MSLFSDVVKVVNLQGKLKSNKKQASELFFDFPINNIGTLCNEIGNFVHLDKPFEAIFYEWFGLKSWSSDLKKKLPG